LYLTGDSTNGNVYGVTECQDDNCLDGGAVWRYDGASAAYTDDWFSPPKLICGTGTYSDIAVSPVFSIGGSPYTLDYWPCGPRLLKGNAGTWTPQRTFLTNCQAPSALWAASTTDFFVAVGCSQTGIGQIWHWDGTNPQTTSLVFPSAADYADAMYGTSLSDVWAVGTQRWHCTANCGGSSPTWALDPTPMPGVDTTLWGTGTDYYAGGSYNNVYHYTTASQTWTQECINNGTGPAPNAYSISGDGQGGVYAATSIGLMQRN